MWTYGAEEAFSLVPDLLLTGFLAMRAVAPEIAIVGFVPGVSDPDQALTICWLPLLGTLACMGPAFPGPSAEPSAAPTVQHRVRATVAGSM